MLPGRDPPEAITLAQHGVELAPTAANYHILATVYGSLGNRTGARQALSKAIELEPANPKYQHAYQNYE